MKLAGYVTVPGIFHVLCEPVQDNPFLAWSSWYPVALGRTCGTENRERNVFCCLYLTPRCSDCLAGIKS